MSEEKKDLLEDEEELDLSSLSDEDLVLQMHDDLYDGLKEEIEEGTNILLERGWTPDAVLSEALVEGMRIVGIDFRDGILFVPEVLLSANAMKGGMAILRPLLAETGAETMPLSGSTPVPRCWTPWPPTSRCWWSSTCRSGTWAAWPPAWTSASRRTATDHRRSRTSSIGMAPAQCFLLPLARRLVTDLAASS